MSRRQNCCTPVTCCNTSQTNCVAAGCSTGGCSTGGYVSTNSCGCATGGTMQIQPQSTVEPTPSTDANPPRPNGSDDT
jgi:hypothetical protein